MEINGNLKLDTELVRKMNKRIFFHESWKKTKECVWQFLQPSRMPGLTNWLLSTEAALTSLFALMSRF